MKTTTLNIALAAFSTGTFAGPAPSMSSGASGQVPDYQEIRLNARIKIQSESHS